MLRCIPLFIILFLLFINISIVKAEDNVSIYASGRLIYNALRINGPSEKFDDMNQTTSQFGFGLATGLRHKFGVVGLRYELDYSFNMKKISYYHAFMFNVYLEASLPRVPIAPYIMVGGGLNMFDPPSPHLESGLAYNYGGGVLYYFNDKLALDLNFRYMQASINFDVGEGFTDVKNHMFNIGFQYVF